MGSVEGYELCLVWSRLVLGGPGLSPLALVLVPRGWGPALLTSPVVLPWRALGLMTRRALGLITLVWWGMLGDVARRRGVRHRRQRI